MTLLSCVRNGPFRDTRLAREVASAVASMRSRR